MTYMDGDLSYKRIAAYAIDTSFVIIVSMILVQILNMVPGGSAWSILFVILVLIAGYLIPYNLWPGQTYGKKNQKIQLVNMDDSPIKKWKVILRELFKMIVGISTVGIYFIVAGIIMLFRKDERTIHDFIFRTKVIEKTVIRKVIRKEEEE